MAILLCGSEARQIDKFMYSTSSYLPHKSSVFPIFCCALETSCALNFFRKNKENQSHVLNESFSHGKFKWEVLKCLALVNSNRNDVMWDQFFKKKFKIWIHKTGHFGYQNLGSPAEWTIMWIINGIVDN